LTHLIDSDDYPDLIAGLEQPDDAAVWRLDDNRALVVTTDFFTPVVDNPYDYGAIAAANSLSDVYAMGAKPFLALNVAAFPSNLPVPVITEILRGGIEKANEAGVVIAGGHTIKDEEPKYGLMALGFANPNKILRKSGAKIGDVILLSKPLGTGVITTALKQDKAESSHLTGAVGWMKRLNNLAGETALKMDAHAATDITGFGFIGHAWEMAQASGAGMSISFKDIPFIEGARLYAEKGIFPGGAYDNFQYFKEHVKFNPGLSEWERLLLYDPQTSGGLLVAVAEESYNIFISGNNARNPFWKIGEIIPEKRILVTEN
jgi:selenide, water dikinase